LPLPLPSPLLAIIPQYTPPPHHNSYDYLIVAPGLKTDFSKIPGLLEALQDPSSKVSTIYKEDSVEQVWSDIQQFEGGKAVSCSSAWSAEEEDEMLIGVLGREQIFTQPAGIIKCAGAPQKVSRVAV